MARASNLQTNFLGGEWSPFFQGRADHKNYKTAMNVCRNGYPVEEGAWVRRPGFRLLGATTAGASARAYAVEFTEDEPIDVIFTDGFLNFMYGNAPLLTPGVPAVTSISADTPAILDITANTYNWATGDQVLFLFGEGTAGFVGEQLRGGRVFTLTQVDTALFALTDTLTGAPLNGAPINTSDLSNCAVGRLARVASPFTAGTWVQCRIAQNQEFGLILGSSEPPQVLTIQGFAPVATEYAWLGPNYPIATATIALIPLVMLDGPYLDPVVDSSNTPSVLNWTGGTVTGPPIVAGGGTYAGGAAIGAIVAVKQPLMSGVTSGQYAFFSYTGKLPNSAGGGAGSATAPAGYISDGNGWAPADPTGVASQATGVFTVTAGFQAWKVLQYYLPNNCVSVSTQAYQCIEACVGINPGTTSGWATYWTAIDSGYAVTGLANATVGFQATDVGRMVRMLSQPADYDPTILYGDGTLVMYGDQAYTHTGEHSDAWVGNITSIAGTAAISPTTFTAPQWGTIPFDAWGNSQTGTPDAVASTATMKPGWSPVTNAANWIWGRITAVASTSQATVTLDPGSAPMLSPLNFFQINTWRMGAFATGAWPASGSFYEGRFWFGGAIKNRFDTSQSLGWVPGNTVLTMAPTETTGDLETGYANDGTVTDACGISYTLESKDKNNIFWFEPDKEGLLLGTIGGEWMVAASALNDPITPTSIQAKRVTKYGCADIEPKRTGMGLVFIQKFLHRVMEFLPQVFVGGFIAPHLNEAAKHLSTKTLVEVAYQEELTPLLWFRTGVGALVGAIYRRISAFLTDGTTVIGWHRHDLGRGDILTSLSVNATPTGTLDALTVITNNGSNWVQKATQLFDEDDALVDAWFLDAALVPDTIFQDVVGAITGVRLTGLWFLGGQTATITILGLDCGDFPVDATTGTAFVPYGSGVAPALIDYTSPGAGAYLLTAAYIAANTTAVIPRNGGAMVQLGTLVTTPTVVPLSVQSFVPAAAVGGSTDTNSNNALIDWTKKTVIIPAQTVSGLRQFDAVSGVELFAYSMDTITGGSGTYWGNNIGAIQAGKAYFSDDTGNYVPLVRADMAALTKDYIYGQYSSTGPPTYPGIVNPESMAVSGSFILVSSSTTKLSLSGTAAGGYSTAAIAWATAQNFSWTVVDRLGQFHLLNSAGALYHVLPVPATLTLIGTILSPNIDPTWTNGVGTFSGVAVDQTDNGVLFYAKGNFNGLSAYDAGTTYGAGAMIYDAAVDIYTSRTVGNIGHTPSTSPTYWQKTTLQYLVKWNVPGTIIKAGALNIGQKYHILSTGTTNWVALGAANNLVGTEFVTIGAGTGTGTCTPTFGLAWAIPSTYMPNGPNDMMAKSRITNSVYAFISPKVGGISAAVTVNTASGAFTSVGIPGIDVDGASQAYDFVTNSILFNGAFDSTVPLGPLALNSTVTCGNTWLRLYLGNTLNTVSGEYVNAGLVQAVVGYTYTSQGQTLRPISPDDTGAKVGPGFAKTRRSHLIGMLLHNTMGLQFGTDFTTSLQPAILKDGKTGNIGKQLLPNVMFSGMYRYPLKDDYSYDSMLAWQIVRPYPAALVSVGAFLETQDL